MKKQITILSALILSFTFVASVSAATFTVGNDATSRPVVDTYTNFTIIDTNNPSAVVGELNTFDYYAVNTNPFRFVLVNGSAVVQWVSDQIIPVSAGVQTFGPVSVYVEPGWSIGLYFAQSGTVPFEYNAQLIQRGMKTITLGLPVAGETLNYAGSSDRYYSFVATGKIYPYGEIIEPTIDEYVTGITDLVALYKDGDAINDDAVNWAVRYETCNVNTDTMFGNVDGHSDTFIWDGMDFSAQINTSTVSPGHYCFVFNPTDDGSVDVRETRWFYIESLDDDDDGVLNGDDLCSDTTKDNLDVDLGVNRHVWYSDEYFTTLVPARKGSKVLEDSQFSLVDTYGCSCEQILDSMSAITGFDFEGHYKYGCSKSLIEDWIDGRYYLGLELLETVEVPANDADGVESTSVLDSGTDYILKVSGTAMACNQSGCVINFDAEYSTSDPINPWSTWTDGVAAPYNVYGRDLLDLKVNGNFVDWGTYNSSHEYEYNMIGTDTNLALGVYDLPGSYFNDTGSLFVEIWFHNWVDLW